MSEQEYFKLFLIFSGFFAAALGAARHLDCVRMWRQERHELQYEIKRLKYLLKRAKDDNK